MISLINSIDDNMKNICENGLDIDEYKSCVGKRVNDGNYCCFVSWNYLGNNAKYCLEFAKKDIDNNKVFDTIDKIQKGLYWEGKIQTYDIYSLRCENTCFIKINTKNFIFLVLLLFHII